MFQISLSFHQLVDILATGSQTFNENRKQRETEQKYLKKNVQFFQKETGWKVRAKENKVSKPVLFTRAGGKTQRPAARLIVIHITEIWKYKVISKTFRGR